MKKPILRAALPAALALCATGATAAPFELTFTSTVTDTFDVLPGTVAAGDLFLLTVIIDNGGTSAVSQNWTYSDMVSATATAGAYKATFTDGFLGDPGFAFTTSGTGALTSVNFTETSGSSTTSWDNISSGNPFLFLNIIFTGDLGGIVIADPLNTDSAWSDPVAASVAAPIPLPTSLSLMLGGLAALGGLAVARRRAA